LAGSNTTRFLLNSTWGLGGVFDVAAAGGLEPRRQDFGLTLAKWGYQESTYIVLPFLGPSTVRDTIGRFVTYEMGLPAHLKSVAWRNRLIIGNYVDTRMSLLKVDPLMEEAVDQYIFARDAYFQHRTYEIGDKEAGSIANREIKLEGPPE
jgi:phospholipid-binding lipoprotein MlaA